jgi:hypothetical protein
MESHNLNVESLFDSVLCAKMLIDCIEGLGMEISFATFTTDLRLDIFDDVEPVVQPMLPFDMA